MIHDIIMAVAVATATTTSANGKKNTEKSSAKSPVYILHCVKKMLFRLLFFLRNRKTTKFSFCCYWNWLQSVSFARSPIGVQHKISEVDFFPLECFIFRCFFIYLCIFFSLFLSFSNFIFASDSFVLGNQIAVTAISYV